MPQEKKKIKLIVSELLDYFLNQNIDNLNITIQKQPTQINITLSAPVQQLPADMDEILNKLNTPRQPEMEDYYEDLLGLREHRFDVEVLATMVDAAEVTLDDNSIMTFSIVRLSKDK
ncbi:hypothetical protein [Fundicoccus culcitae]|uniref:Na+-translocating membrane potential-generating system MpsC domain-containing protein n=1 Tax=Fundicoccus culcitae TaxID=2969821 RepID=A0ABY5P7G1_9LACT|nr:hypothetical protein [Fundicoccus culcitae]UUX34674.1 hypothetical protein NRE15_03200 [Fundicoccus culcitae]